MPASPTITKPALPKTRVRWNIFLILLALVSINYIDRASLSVALPLISQEFGIDPAWQGLILSAFFWSYALMQIPGGLLADRFKPRLIIACATIGWGAFQALAALAAGPVLLIVTRLGLGISEAPIYPGGAKLSGSWLTAQERGRGAALLDGGAPLGAALGSIVIAGLISSFGSWRAAFVVSGLGTILCGLVAWWYIRNSPAEHTSVNAAELDHIAAANAVDEDPVETAGANPIQFFTFRSVWCMCLGWMFFNTVFYGLLTWMPTYLYKTQGLDIKTLGGASFAIFFAGFVGELVGGFIADGLVASGMPRNRVYKSLFGFSALAATASIFLVGYATNAITVVLLLGSTLFFLRWCGMYWVIPAAIGTRRRIGFLGGCLNLGGNLAGILVPIIVGLIVQATGSYYLALMFFAAAGLGLFACSVLIDYERKILL